MAAFGSAIGRGGTGIRAELFAGSAGLASDLSPPQPQPLLQPQLGQPQLASQQPQLGSEQQLEQQPQPPQWNMPQRLFKMQQPCPQPQPQLLQQLDSQPQDFSQPQLASQPHDFSQPQLFSQPQPQLGSEQQLEQQPQPPQLNMPQRLFKMQQPCPQPQPQELPQLEQPQLGASQPQDFSQPQLASQPQLFSQPQPQLGSLQHPQQLEPQPQPPQRNMPHRLSRMQQPPQELQLLQQPDEQPQLGASELQPQLGASQHDFSQQPQLGSLQQPQPHPSIRSSKQHAPKLGLTRAMLTMSAPKKFPFIEHRLLKFGTYRAKGLPTSNNARCRPTPYSRRQSERMHGYAEQFGRRKGHIKVLGVENRRDVLAGSKVGRHHRSSQSLTRLSPGQ
jgi:hypothetical protein